jgi:hypothetical protein
LQPVVFKVIQYLFHPPFRFPEENGIRVRHGLFRMKHGGNPAADDLDAFLPVTVCDFPSPFYLAGQHHGNADEISVVVSRQGFDIFVNEFDIDPLGKGGGENNGTVWGKMEFRLPIQFFPLRINQSEFHAIVLFLPGALPQCLQEGIRGKRSLKNVSPLINYFSGIMLSFRHINAMPAKLQALVKNRQ